jgi:malate dehydrogenase (oxaloacetate-decarboxylating)
MQVGGASIPVAQCDNIYIFPGLGLAVTAEHATRVTDAMLTAAAAAVGNAATIRPDPHRALLPGSRPEVPPRTPMLNASS